MAQASILTTDSLAVLIAIAFLGFIASAILASLFLLTSLYLFKKHGVTLFPKLTLFIARIGENLIIKGFMIFGVGGDWMAQTLVALKNHVGKEEFKEIAFNERAIFVPQCIRSATCPAKSDYEGLHCISCGQCTIGDLKKEAEDMGYMFFVAPGSSLVKRMVKQYKPKGALGLGCLFEIKEFLILMTRLKVAAYGVVLATSGCVETTFNVEKLRTAMRMQ